MKMEIEPLHIKKLAECFNSVHYECESEDKHLVNTNTSTLAPVRLRSPENNLLK